MVCISHGKESRRSHVCTPPHGMAQLGAWVVCAGHWISRQHFCGPRVFDDFVLIYCVKGRGYFRAGDRAFNVSAGDIFLAHAGTRHWYRSDEHEGWDIWWLHARGDQLTRLAAFAGLPIDTPLRRIGACPRVLGAYRTIFSTLGRHDLHAWLDASVALQRLFVELRKLDPASGDGHSTQLLLNAADEDPTGLDAMARRAGVSRFAFLRAFRKATGTTPWRFILNRRIGRAKELLIDTDLPIKTIAHELGFADANYFSRLFRKETGIAARDYRRAERQAP